MAENTPSTAPEDNLKAGDRVRLLVDSPEGNPVEGTVRLVQDEAEHPGKLIGVELDNYVLFGHTLDGELDAKEKIDETNGKRFGKGWWSRPEYLEVLKTV